MSAERGRFLPTPLTNVIFEKTLHLFDVKQKSNKADHISFVWLFEEIYE
ncbi:MAG TPA: hypothetical protein VNU45_08485 [Rummeliibacillus sp.]|nr:hypothetical protein [Rummeliibacillus sp.]